MKNRIAVFTFFVPLLDCIVFGYFNLTKLKGITFFFMVLSTSFCNNDLARSVAFNDSSILND